MQKIINSTRGAVTLRPATPADAPAFRALRLFALRDYPAAFGADLETSQSHPLEYWVKRLESSDDNITFVAAHGDELIGMCVIRRNDSLKTAHGSGIFGVFVHPAWRGLRIMDSMLAMCAEWAGQHEITVMRLGVITTNTAAIRCYARCGFTIYGIEPRSILWDGVMYDELLMARFV